MKKEHEDENLHKGHRERLRMQVFLSEKAFFHDHQILELLILFSRPRVDTNPIAHRLVNKFGSLDEVLLAPHEKLVTVLGVGDKTAKLLVDVGSCIQVSKKTAKKSKKLLDIFELVSLSRSYCQKQRQNDAILLFPSRHNELPPSFAILLTDNYNVFDIPTTCVCTQVICYQKVLDQEQIAEHLYAVITELARIGVIPTRIVIISDTALHVMDTSVYRSDNRQLFSTAVKLALIRNVTVPPKRESARILRPEEKLDYSFFSVTITNYDGSKTEMAKKDK